MALIDLSNYDTLLVQSTVGRSGTPDGNIFFDSANNILEIITVEEQATINMTQHGGGASDPNPLSEQDGIRLEAIYAFENQERRTDEALRKFDRMVEGNFKFGGAYNFVNGNTPYDTDKGGANSDTGDDRFKIRGSGWSELYATGTGRIYYGVKSLSNIEALSQPYYQLALGGIPTDFGKDGDIDEAVQVLGNATIDTNTTTFDTRTFLSNKIRTFGQNYDEKQLADSGITEMGGYFTGFALGESVHLTSGNYTLADVYGGAQIAPWTNMGLEELDVAQTETGFNEADGDFTWVVNNTSGGSLDEMVAFLDALAQTDDDINDHGTNVTNGKRVGTWYSYNAGGQIVTDAPFAGQGLFLEQLPVSDQQRVVFTDDAGGTKTYPFAVGVEVTVGAIAVADVLTWYHAFFLDAGSGKVYNSALAETVIDSLAGTVKGNVSTDEVSNRIDFGFNYDSDTVGGPAGTAKDVVFLVEGDGGATQAKTIFTITRITTVSASCIPSTETNV